MLTAKDSPTAVHAQFLPTVQTIWTDVGQSLAITAILPAVVKLLLCILRSF